MFDHDAWILFFALFGLYSPLAALGSYLPITRGFTQAQILQLSVGLLVNVAVFVLAAIWVGEPLLKLLGISVAALTATGGIALAYAAIPLMRGKAGAVEELDAAQDGSEPAPVAAPTGDQPPASPLKSMLFTPITFPLTVGGTTFAFGVAASADASGGKERLFLSIAAVLFAAVTGATFYFAGHVERRISLNAALILDRVAGILLTAIAVTLLANGFTDLVIAAVHR